jgi:hypothetical protein
MVGMIKPKVLVADSGGTVYEFGSERHYVDEVNGLTNSARLPRIAKALVDALNSGSGAGRLKKPITILIDGQVAELEDKLLDWLGLLPDDAIDKLIKLFERAEGHGREHGDVGILFGLCFDPSVKGVQVAIPNVFQTGLIPVVITTGEGVLKLGAN